MVLLPFTNYWYDIHTDEERYVISIWTFAKYCFWNWVQSTARFDHKDISWLPKNMFIYKYEGGSISACVSYEDALT